MSNHQYQKTQRLHPYVSLVSRVPTTGLGLHRFATQMTAQVVGMRRQETSVETVRSAGAAQSVSAYATWGEGQFFATLSGLERHQSVEVNVLPGTR